MRPSIIAISDPLELARFSDERDEFMRRSSTNPFCLTGFVKEMMQLNHSRGWCPLVLCLTRDGATIGVAPLMTKIRFGVRYARFLLEPWMSSDFIFDDTCREFCMRFIIDYIFRTLHCAVLDLTLPAESRNANVLETVCEGSGFHCRKRAVSGHTIIRVKGTWDEFTAARGRNFKKYFKLLERRLNRSGSWRIVRLSCDGRDSGAIERIHCVEKSSWKEAQRKKTGKIDPTLSLCLKASKWTAERELDFRSWGCFLELGSKTLAYVLVLEYKGAALLVKTSFDERFREYYPGTYVLNESIRQLFDEEGVNTIDFVADLPFHKRWSSTCPGRVRVTMSRRYLSLYLCVLWAFVAETRIIRMMRKPSRKITRKET